MTLNETMIAKLERHMSSPNLAGEAERTTLAHRISRVTPTPVVRALRPKWHIAREVAKFRFGRGGRLKWVSDLHCWQATIKLPRGTLYVPVRSYRNLRQITQFGADPKSLVFDWLNAIDDCEMLYDIGASNGYEGMYTHAAHDCHVASVEMFVPSVENILLAFVMTERAGRDMSKIDVMLGACDIEPSYKKLKMHNLPVAGGTRTSFDNVEEYGRGGRGAQPVFASHWSPAVSIDSLHGEFGLPVPSHVKIDVDGFEGRVMRGASETVAARLVRQWIIEVSPERQEEIAQLMAQHGYVEIAHHEHYPGKNDCFDRLYVRDDIVAEAKEALENSQQMLKHRRR